MVTIGAMGALRRVCRNANKQALDCRLSPFVRGDASFGKNADAFKKCAFDTIWLASASSFRFLEDYWLEREVGG